MQLFIEKRIKRGSLAWKALRYCWHAIAFLILYIHALASCLFLFLIGFAFPSNRSLMRQIYFHFSFSKILQYFRKQPKIIIQDAGLKKKLESYQYARFAMYVDVMHFLSRMFHGKKINDPKIIEFGGSNGIIKDMFRHPAYEVGENYPAVDIHDLGKFKPGYYDFVIIDQVLEHVRDPKKCVQEIHRILKKYGWLIATVPFLVKIHESPGDYWRFSKQGMKELMSGFSEVIVKSWGNKEALVDHIIFGDFPSTGEAKKRGIFNLINEETLPHTVWCFSRK